MSEQSTELQHSTEQVSVSEPSSEPEQLSVSELYQATHAVKPFPVSCVS